MTKVRPRTRFGKLSTAILSAALAGCAATGHDGKLGRVNDRPAKGNQAVPRAVADFSHTRRKLDVQSPVDRFATPSELAKLDASKTVKPPSGGPVSHPPADSAVAVKEDAGISPVDFVRVEDSAPRTVSPAASPAPLDVSSPELRPERLSPKQISADVPLPPSPSDGATSKARTGEIPASGDLAAQLLGMGNQSPIDLASALEMTAGQNPQVGYTQQRIREAYAQQRSAEYLWVPSLRAGVNYNKHDGVIQDVAGNILTNSRSSVYTGFGGQAVGAASPAVPGLLMNFHFRDAIFQPRIAEQVVGARQQANRASVNDMLLEASLRYMDLLEAMQVFAIAQETLEHAETLGKLTADFATAGEGLQSDADRASAELSVRQIEFRRAAENVRVASVRLARLLSQQDQSQMLVPQEPALAPIDLVNTGCPLSELVATGLSNRPELSEARFLVGEAVQRLRRERYAPLVPSVLLGLSYGGNGGSPNSDIRDFGDRVDFDAGAYWEIRNLGIGEQNARNETRARLEQARWRQVQVMDQVAADVAEAHAQVEARRSQIELAQSGITAAENSYRRNVARIQDGQGLPIETLQSLQALDQARRQYARAVADYNRAQFQLHRALGSPIG